MPTGKAGASKGVLVCFDTPWSDAVGPLVSTVALRPDRVAEHVAGLVELVLPGWELKIRLELQSRKRSCAEILSCI